MKTCVIDSTQIQRPNRFLKNIYDTVSEIILKLFLFNPLKSLLGYCTLVGIALFEALGSNGLIYSYGTRSTLINY